MGNVKLALRFYEKDTVSIRHREERQLEKWSMPIVIVM